MSHPEAGGGRGEGKQGLLVKDESPKHSGSLLIALTLVVQISQLCKIGVPMQPLQTHECVAHHIMEGWGA